MKTLRHILLLTFFFGGSVMLFAQSDTTIVYPTKARFLYDVDFYGYFDNREYKSPYGLAQTLFAVRLSPEIGVGFSDKQGGQHRVMAGVHYTQPMGGAGWTSGFPNGIKEWHCQFDPTVYYQYTYKGFRLNFGAIPYEYRIERLPDFLMYDSIAYMQPNLQGALFQYTSRHGYVEAMCDWRGMPSASRKEMFRIVINGNYQYRGYFTYTAGGWAQLNHKANLGGGLPHEGVADDILAIPQVGIDFAPPTPLDTLLLNIGYIGGMQRDRADGAIHYPHGLLCNFELRWKWIALKNTLYWGDNQLVFYERHQHDLNQGDPFYRQPFYDKLGLELYILRKPFIHIYGAYNLHFVPNCKPQHQQQVIVRFMLDKIPGLGG